MLKQILDQLKQFPEYFVALKSAVAVLAMGLPIYVGLRYFLYRRRLSISLGVTLNFIGAFILFAGLAFLLASPLARYLPGQVISAYLFVTCIAAALGVVSCIDVFFIQHYLVHVKGLYISPPLRTGVKVGVFCLALLPILRFVLHFNPLALIAIPTIATAGVALALQDTLKAFIAGIGLGRIIRLGEWISFQGKDGKVMDINWARTVLETSDGDLIYIPNNLLQTQLFMNYSNNGFHRMAFQFALSHHASPGKVKDIMLRAAQNIPGVATNPAPEAQVLSHDEGSSKYVLYYWISEYGKRYDFQNVIGTRVWNAFRQEQIEIPTPFASAPLQKRGQDVKRLISLMEQWDLARAFSPADLELIAQDIEERTYMPGEVIVRKGDAGDSVFLIVEGQVDVFSHDAETHPAVTLNKGQVFGEMSLLTGEPRSATVRARGLVQLLEIGDTGLRRVLAQQPALTEKLAQLVEKRRTDTTELAKTGASASSAASSSSLRSRIRQFFDL